MLTCVLTGVLKRGRQECKHAHMHLCICTPIKIVTSEHMHTHLPLDRVTLDAVYRRKAEPKRTLY